MPDSSNYENPRNQPEIEPHCTLSIVDDGAYLQQVLDWHSYYLYPFPHGHVLTAG